MGIVVLMSAFDRRFSGGGVWFIQDKFALTGNLVIKTGHMAGSYGQYKMQTADRVQNAD